MRASEVASKAKACLTCGEKGVEMCGGGEGEGYPDKLLLDPNIFFLYY